MSLSLPGTSSPKPPPLIHLSAWYQTLGLSLTILLLYQPPRRFPLNARAGLGVGIDCRFANDVNRPALAHHELENAGGNRCSRRMITRVDKLPCCDTHQYVLEIFNPAYKTPHSPLISITPTLSSVTTPQPRTNPTSIPSRIFHLFFPPQQNGQPRHNTTLQTSLFRPYLPH